MKDPATAARAGAAPEPGAVDLGPKPRLGYAGSALDRAADRRLDPAFLQSAESAADAGAYAVAGDLVVMRKGAHGLDPLFAPAEARALAPVDEAVFLGLDEGRARFGLGIAAAAVDGLKARSDLQLADLRSIAVQGLVAPEHLPPLAEAKAMLQWHARHRFCANCGAPTLSVCAGWKRDCPACKAEHFPRTDPVVIMLAIDGDLCLLGRQTRFVPGMWSCLAGFVEPGETIEEAARREIREEAGVICGRIKYFASQPWPFPMSLMIGCHAEAIATEITVDRSELEDARWFSRREVAQMLAGRHPEKLATPPPVAIAHHIIRAWVEVGADVLR
ncbi:MAG: NAD(+) diphosphatase [Variibacter sp.]|nr:NAD(+) diphosphatase [Variibacter sp.]